MRTNGAAVIVVGSLIAALLAAIVPGSATGSSTTVPGVVLTQQDSEGTSVLTLGPDSAKLLFTGVGDSSPSFGTILHYRARRAIAFDPVRAVYVDLSFTQALARLQRQSKDLAVPSTLPEGVSAPASPLRANLRRLPGSVSVNGERGRVSEVRLGSTTLRVTYATDIPQPPSDLLGELADPALRRNPFDRALGTQLSGVPVRAEACRANRCQRTLDTVRMQTVTLGPKAFDLPGGLRLVSEEAFFEGAYGLVSGASALVLPVIPSLPLVMHPRVTGLDWFDNSTPAAHALAVYLDNGALEEAIRTTYGGSLAQYGVIRLPGVHTRSHPVGNNPPRSIGSNSPEGAARVYLMLWDQMIKGRAPAYWICCIQHDPMIFIFVIKEDVDSAEWGGYHFWVPTLGALVPWPLSLWIQPGLPYTVVKVPCAARAPCGSGVTMAAARTEASVGLSHEYVEAATDPFPFYGWVDLTKQPVWMNGEISDICSNDPHNSAVINGYTFATYWSNLAHRCVP